MNIPRCSWKILGCLDKFKTLFFEDVPDYFVTPNMVELCEYAIVEEECVNQNRVRKLKNDG